MKNAFILLGFLIFIHLSAFAQSGWIAQTSGVNYGMDAVFFVGNTGYSVGGSGQTNANVVLKTVDGGKNWTVRCITDTQFYSIFFTDSLTGCAVDYYGILQTTDGGATWTRVFHNHSFSKYSFLHQIFFPDARTGYCVGGFDHFNPILKTSDGGKTWTDKTSAFNQPLYDVYFINADTGYVVGHAGTILKTNDGGNTWNKQSSETIMPLLSVYFPEPDKGYVVGSGGTIMETHDGGSHWTAQASHTTKDLVSVYFTNAHTGYAVGGLAIQEDCCHVRYEGIILKTTDGGATWTSQPGAETNYLYSVWFTDDLTGYAAGSNGLLLKTTTGGIYTTAEITPGPRTAIYPNPNNGEFTLKLTNERQQLLQIDIRDLNGQIVYHAACADPVLYISQKELPKGLYLVCVRGEDTFETHKMVVK